MFLNVTLRARWRRALTSLASLVLVTPYDYPFCLCHDLLSLLDPEHPTRSDILTLLVLLLSLALVFFTQLLNFLYKYYYYLHCKLSAFSKLAYYNAY